MSFSLPLLPYALDALEPHMSKDTLSFHYEKHHRAYIEKLNSLLKPQHTSMTLEEIIEQSTGPLFNNAAQVWNHGFYWHSMTPDYQPPSAGLHKRIVENFQSWELFQTAFQSAALGQFGSGWVWLIEEKPEGKLSIVSTGNAALPDHGRPLLVCDVWEHAYYLDYQNRRDVYVQTFFSRLAHWSWVEARLQSPWAWR